MIRNTSIKAYLNEIAPTLGSRQVLVLEVFERNPGRDLTNSEIARALDWSINRVTGRVKELREMQLLEESRKRRCGVTGRPVHAWRMKDAPVVSPRAIKDPPVFHQLPSASTRGGMHTVKESAGRVACNCRGFYWRQTCSHVRKIAAQPPKFEEQTASLFS